MGKYKMHSKF